MRESWALVRASWQTASSYRLGVVLSVLSLVAVIVPLYFVTTALQGVMAPRIAEQGPQYFGFALVGAVVFSLISATTSALPNAVGAAISQGTLEAILATPARVASVMAGLSGYAVGWALVRGALVLAAGTTLGLHLVWHAFPLALVVVALVLVAYGSVGLVSAALVLRFRTSGPLVRAVLTGSMFLGGVYYPTHVIPSWIRELSAVLPLTYGLRALRQLLLAGAPVGAVSRDLGILAALAGAMAVGGTLALASALRHARREGTLSQY